MARVGRKIGASCVDCRWLKMRVELDRGSNFTCLKKRLGPGERILWKKPCVDFEPLETEQVLPAAPASPLRPIRRLPLRPPELFQPPDPDSLRRFFRDRKDFSLRSKLMDEHEAVRRFVQDGDYLGFELYGTVRCPLSIVREIVRQKKKNLRLMGQGLMDVDLPVAAGLVSAMDISYVGYEAYGLSPILRRAVEKGALRLAEWSNAALAWRLKAAAMGLPFLPSRVMLGSATLAFSPARTMTDPFTGMRLALLPALSPDCAVVHVHRADAYGNCQIDGISGFAEEISRASKRLIVTAEQIVDTETFRAHPERTVIPYFLVDAVVHAPFGAHPGETCGLYRRDEDHIRMFLEAARTEKETLRYLEEFIDGVSGHEDYLKLIGQRRLEGFKVKGHED